ncbi:MAG TPA: polynucleotide adenylyltransferase PcnB [Burkholderiales bacterium]|nr:polynucleotide adenylyltransferase PcnB [Burkholderiales bacterium]
MITKFLGKVFSGRLFKQHGGKNVPFSAHGIARERISPCALKTVETLQQHKHTAFIVGGAVRDAILGRTPKDFDVATSATPEQVRALFRRSRIIGRRFKIVHVMCGRETVEVSTYRAGAIGNEDNDQQVTDEHGRLLRDNVYGTQEQDALRRDFTINALFYDPTTQQVWDFHDGVEDLKKKRLRMIGDPEQRYREDPVRMLRAVRFSASRGLEIDQATREPIKAVTPLLAHVPAARLFDEMLKLLMSGHAYECVMALRREGLHHGLLPMLDVILEQPMGERFVLMALRNTDARINSDKSVSPSFLFASLLWHEVLATWKKLEDKGVPEIPALYEAMDEVAQSQAAMLAIPRRFSSDMKEIWVMQPRFLQRTGRRPYRLLENPRFRAAYDFLLLRCASGEVDPEVGEWWTRFQHADEHERSALLAQQGAEPAKRKRRRKRRAPSAAAALPIDSGPS